MTRLAAPIAVAAAGLLLAAAPALAGSIGYANNQSCSVSANAVSCNAQAGRGTLVIEASGAAFTKLRDALLQGRWQSDNQDLCGASGSDGCLACSACMVASGIAGCAAEGDLAVASRKTAALAQLTCVLRSFVIEKDLREGLEAVPGTIDQNPDVGGGNPG